MTAIDKTQFARLLEEALDNAAWNAEMQLGRSVPRHFQIVLHGAGYPGQLMSPAEVVDVLYLGEDRFFKAIDVTATEVTGQSTKVFVRASDHRPVPFDETWNYHSGTGPFKQLLSRNIAVTP
jgi:hypothetical protein